MNHAIVICSGCAAKNRLRTAAAHQIPRCGRCRAPLPWLIDATDQTFDREIDLAVPILVDLWAPWCAPCRMLAPVLAELAGDLAGRLKVIQVDVDRNPALASRFNARSIPMLLILRGGEVVGTMTGVQSGAALRAALEPFLPS